MIEADLLNKLREVINGMSNLRYEMRVEPYASRGLLLPGSVLAILQGENLYFDAKVVKALDPKSVEPLDKKETCNDRYAALTHSIRIMFKGNEALHLREVIDGESDPARIEYSIRGDSIHKVTDSKPNALLTSEKADEVIFYLAQCFAALNQSFK